MYVSEWLIEKNAACTDTEYKQQRHEMLKGFSMFWQIAHDSRPRVLLNRDELERLAKARESLLYSYHYLTKFNVARGSSHYHMRPKYHRIDHCIRRALRTRVSPALY